MEQNYRLNFKSPSDPSRSRWRGGAATIEPHSGGVVWGVVWKLNETDKESLDRFSLNSQSDWLGQLCFWHNLHVLIKFCKSRNVFLFYLYVV